MNTIVQEASQPVMRVLIIGCGDIGCRAGVLLASLGHHVTGVRRRADKLPSQIRPLAADVLDAGDLPTLSAADYDVLIYTLSASAFSESAYRRAYVEGMTNVVNIVAPRIAALKRIVFVSSTAVYHQDDHSWVDETSPTQPQRFNGTLMLAAEHIALATGTGTCVRFSGIYGSSRWGLIEKVRRRGVSPQTPLRYTNRIHAEDCAGVLSHIVALIAKEKTVAPIYLGSDSAPAPAHDVESFIAEQLGGNVDDAIIQKKSNRNPGSKRCSNQRLLDSGYEFHYPSYRTGYQRTVAEYLAKSIAGS